MDPRPPLRSTHLSGSLVFDRWGRYGRPVLLLHGLLFDRTMWWPVGAELAGVCSVIAPDLPGHGDSPACEDPDPQRLARDLATLVNRLDLHRAPIVVGHATSAPLAAAFAGAYATHHVRTIDERAVGDLSEVPECYRPYAQPRHDRALLHAYAGWADPVGAPSRTASFPHLTDPAAFAESLRTLL